MKKIENNCGKKGCDINLYVLPYSATKEAFDQYKKECVADQKQEEVKVKEFSKI